MYFSVFFLFSGDEGQCQKKKKKANVNWNFSKASLCRKDMHEFIGLNDVKLEEAIGEKLPGIRIYKYRTWNLNMDYVISKLNCRINLLKR